MSELRERQAENLAWQIEGTNPNKIYWLTFHPPRYYSDTGFKVFILNRSGKFLSCLDQSGVRRIIRGQARRFKVDMASVFADIEKVFADTEALMLALGQ